MVESQFEFRECLNPSCRFRFPVETFENELNGCPRCGGEELEVAAALAGGSSRQWRGSGPDVVALLDNIRSSYNVGSMFRTADGAGLIHLYLCGITPTPEHPKVSKTALGAEISVPWSQHNNGLHLATTLKRRGFRLWALEDAPGARSLFDSPLTKSDGPIALMLGNERAGVDPGILSICDSVIALPMLGQKRSLNVVVAFGVCAYTLRFRPDW